ncbi:hypothetical protein LEP1GSC185_1095 [Leptospira licerasiae serovar Varillal str. VAR 010]|uniref:Uncharacterized protein n=1 Tax=Leptospira licerasiae str. MMD4847 TaxID=1049971 RepID=A0ABN0HAV9_9LEPT|nr:hypothetical protein LEP1GSC185_1095 [Leptospira licerasiae serovar Varillal str. VAR 010]EJZ42766.1 hypothetical protein LEP1GSC178_3448 [Leptospira licerasiae str. MMD4847]EMJ99734.1 hypothetical protein LEP1GSC192_0827 [Leptospira sp. B5-022]
MSVEINMETMFLATALFLILFEQYKERKTREKVFVEPLRNFLHR